MDYSKLTLGELLSSKDTVIRRNAISILKQFQKTVGAIIEEEKRWPVDCQKDHIHDTRYCNIPRTNR